MHLLRFITDFERVSCTEGKFKKFFQLLYAISTFWLFINENSMVNAMYGAFVITALKS